MLIGVESVIGEMGAHVLTVFSRPFDAHQAKFGDSSQSCRKVDRHQPRCPAGAQLDDDDLIRRVVTAASAPAHSIAVA